MTHLAITIIFTVLLAPAIFAVLIPMMPAMSYMFIMALLYGLIDKFQGLQAGEIGILAIIFGLSLLVDYSAGILGAKYAGASKKSIMYGFWGLIVGSLAFPPFGGLPGLFLGVFISEINLNKGGAAAWKAAASSIAGAITGMLLNLALALTFFTLFIIFAFF